MPERKIIKCPRCEKRCIAEESTEQDARPFRKAKKGMCLECCVAGFFQRGKERPEDGLGFALPKDFDPEGLRLPHLQEQFARLMQVGNSEAKFHEIDWDEVIANWHLPFPDRPFKKR